MNQWNPNTRQIKTNQSSPASEFRFYNTSAFPGKITKVVITFSALTVEDEGKLMFVGGSSEINATSGGTAGTWDSSKKTLTWTPASTDYFTYFAFYQNGKAASGTNYLAETDAIVVTYDYNASKTNTSMSFGNDTEFEALQGSTFNAPAVTLKAGEDVLTGKTITYTSSAEDVATVASDGTVTAVGMGKTTITASFAGDSNYNGSYASYDLTVVGVFTSFADAALAAQGTSTEKKAIQMTFNNAKVTSLGTNVAYLTDGTEGKIYQKDHGFVVGNILNGTVRCTMTYNGGKVQFEGVTSTMDGLTVTNAPIINASRKTASFSYGFGSGPSTTESSNVSGTNLSADITATVTTGADYFEISLDGTTYSSSVVAPKDATTSLRIRMKAGLAKANYDGVVTLSSTDAAVVGANMVWDLSSTAGVESSATDVVTWTGLYATMKLEKAGSATSANNYVGGSDGHTRIYKDQILTIAPASGYTISSVQITSTTSTYAGYFTTSAWVNATASNSGSIVTVLPQKGHLSFCVTIGNASRIKTVTVFYEEVSSPIMQEITISEAGWATAYLPFKANVPSGVSAYTVTGAEGTTLTLKNISVIPANTGVLLKGSANTYVFAQSDDAASDATGNMLEGTTEAAGVKFNDTNKIYYILANDPTDGLGFYYQENEGVSATCAQCKAVLAIPKGSSSAIGFRLDGATNVNVVPAATEDNVIYDLTGRRVENATRGIYIVNGKKVLVK